MTTITRQRGALTSRLLDTDSPDDWMTHAECIGMWDAFHPNPGESPKHAKAICRECPVRTPCRAYADRLGDDHGIYGGLTPAERRSQKLARSRIHERECDRCGARFWTQRARFCSKHCRDRTNHANRSTWTPERTPG